MSSASTTASAGVSTTVSSVSVDALSPENILKINKADGPKVLVQPVNPPMPVISPEALGIAGPPPRVASVQDLIPNQNLAALSYFPSAVANVKGQEKTIIAGSCSIAASSSTPVISLPVQVAASVKHYPISTSVPSSVAVPFVSQVPLASHDVAKAGRAPPISHPQQPSKPQESKASIGSFPLRATQPVQTIASTTSLQTSAITTLPKTTIAHVPIRSSTAPQSTLQNIQDIHRLPPHVYTHTLKASTTPPPVTIESRSESKLTQKLHGKSDQKLESFTESKVTGKGDATKLDPKLNWPVSTTKTYAPKQNMFGVPRSIVTSTAIPITYINKPVPARTNATTPIVKPVVGQPVTCAVPSTTTSVPIPIGVASKILQQTPAPRPHASFPDSQAIFLASHRQPVSSVTTAVPGHPSVTIPHNVHQYSPYYFYRGDGTFPRYQFQAPYVGHNSFTPITNAAVRQQLNVNPQVSLQAPSSAGAAATVAAVARAATVAGGPVRLNPMVADLRTTGTPYTIPSLGSADGEPIPGTIYAANASATTNQSVTTPGSSPRPSILRKRHNDGTPASLRKPLFQTTGGSGPASPSSKIDQRQTASPKQSESLSSSQQSTESNVSESNSAQSVLIKIKQEKKDDSISMLSGLPDSLHLPEKNEEPSPRKRQRKQQHKVASQQMLDDKSTDEETETKKDSTPSKKEKLEKKQRKMKLVQYIKRSSLKLLDSYHQTWKPAHNHFQRYSDVKAKDEKKAGIHEIANQRGILKKADGWKIKHVGLQLTDMIGQEQEVYEQMQAIKEGMSSQLGDGIIKTETNRIYELIQGNIQRSQYVLEHIEETKSIMGRLLDHKPKVVSIIKKHANKRHAKKKHAS
ncbi:histone deacetylase complex subunit SAP130-like isoform X2 [Anneissia japonica]|uniref:histone deacetylase complex subunit SAP130-like isoform X2 n=1 Tax=Anneissia japonica TaxID=1529436 RepID=UPI0014257685|nr:histone deacetylase complex subunit SAP130-like isoform X2 [Anneissia japonica]